MKGKGLRLKQVCSIELIHLPISRHPWMISLLLKEIVCWPSRAVEGTSLQGIIETLKKKVEITYLICLHSPIRP